MPVDERNREYKTNISKWKRYRDVVDGEDAIKDRGKTYLPQLSGQTTDQYNAYLMRAAFFSATSRTVASLVGAVFRKNPVIEGNNLDDLQNITSSGLPITSFSKQVLHEVLITARYGILVDVDIEGNNPFMVGYTAESIINWRTENKDGFEKIIMVVLSETREVIDHEDEFKTNEVEIIRVLRLNEGVYAVELYEKTEKEDWVLFQTITPNVKGKPFNEIPFVFVNTLECSHKITKSPIADLANLNLSHYRTYADLEHGRHFTALPTVVIAGVTGNTPIHIGSETAWKFNNPDAKATFLEFTGKGLGALETALDKKEQQMVVLGARILEQQKQAVESAESMKVRKSSENSLLMSVAKSVETGINKALAFYDQWRLQKNTTIKFNDDYNDMKLDYNIISKLLDAVNTGKLSLDTFLYNLERGEYFKEGHTAEDEIELIESETSKTMPTIPQSGQLN